MKKTLSTLLVLILMFLSTATVLYAQEEEMELLDGKEAWTTIDPISDAIQETPNGGQNAEKSAAKWLTGTASSLATQACPTCYKGYEDIPEAMRPGMVGFLENELTAMFNRQPTVDVFAHLAEEWVPGYAESNSVYASGYDDLRSSNIDQIWSISRNIAYAFYVVIMIIIGFMIMFRNKIGGQMMVTIGNALPKIVISLILVTFSFAIVGLIIDVAGVAKGLVDVILYPTEPAGSGINVGDPWSLMSDFMGKYGGSINLRQSITGILKDFGVGLLKTLLAPIVMGFVIVGAIKLWIELIKAYLGLLVNIVIAPLSIMFGALPGNEASMWNVFKSALRNALVFPLAYAIVNAPYALEGRGLSLSLPETLTGDQSNYDETFANLLISVVKIIAIFVACSAPNILKGIIPATAPKSGVNTGEAIKGSLSKMPLLGGMFK